MRTMKNRAIAGLLIASLAAGSLPPRAFADVIPTDAIAAASARDRLALALTRAEVRARLATYGVSPAEVQARVDALSDAEVAQLAAHLDSLPAGGDGIISTLLFVFVLLLLSGLSFLGLGVQPPDADLGSLVRENLSGLPEGAPAVIAPALAIASLTIGMNLLIDSLPGRRQKAR